MASENLVIIPTYNEIENIENIIRAVLALPADCSFDILVVDDGSPDGTAEKVQELQKEVASRLFLLQRKGKQGLGTAYIAGFKWALERDYQYIFEMDADFSHNPKDLPRLAKACQEAGVGVTVGSRYVRGGKLVNWPIKRILMSRGASIYVRLITWMPVSDATAGFVCYKRDFLAQLDFEKIRFKGYAFQIEMKFAAWQLGFKLREVPITFKDREEGASKMSTAIFSEAFWGVWSMRFKAFRDSYARQ
ncbi:polyprenol monophosphomannose synthase [Saprospira grandis]|uniref:polyprenol monophosphomannose synthase n=1 Tax=Saprospira grandis TaxID=1008 RepID=UPI0022DD4F94|nr:polyprenol monophosphomannose synthase [Saprospira grandis]WBM75118.1 polyprenol monophosphomannose synthase [Saprospira grandis]